MPVPLGDCPVPAANRRGLFFGYFQPDALCIGMMFGKPLLLILLACEWQRWNIFCITHAYSVPELGLLFQFFEQLLVLFAAQIQFGEEVGAAFFCSAQGFFPAPFRDLAMIAREQDVRYTPAAKFGWARILWIFKQARAMRLFQCRLFAAQHAREQATYCINNNHRSKFAARQHEIADRDFICDKMLPYTLIHAFIVTAYER